MLGGGGGGDDDDWKNISSLFDGELDGGGCERCTRTSATSF
jgi:hypothetical protein